MKNKVKFYLFNNNTQKTKVIDCNLKESHDLFCSESIKIENGLSDFNYCDITVNDKLLRSFKGGF